MCSCWTYPGERASSSAAAADSRQESQPLSGCTVAFRSGSVPPISSARTSDQSNPAACERAIVLIDRRREPLSARRAMASASAPGISVSTAMPVQTGQDQLLRAALARNDGRQTGSLRFQHDVAEGVGRAGKHEDVGAGVGDGQGLAVERAGQADVLVAARSRLDLGAQGTVTDDHEGRAAGRESLELVDQEAEVLLLGQASDVQQPDVRAVLIAAPEIGAPLARMEALGVDTTPRTRSRSGAKPISSRPSR